MRYSHRETPVEAEELDRRIAEETKKTGKEPKRSKFYHHALGFWMFAEDVIKRLEAKIDKLVAKVDSLSKENTELKEELASLREAQRVLGLNQVKKLEEIEQKLK